jgi:hypothetical protein
LKVITLNEAVITSKKRGLKTRKNGFRSKCSRAFLKNHFSKFFVRKRFESIGSESVHFLETTSAAFSAALYRLLYGPFVLMPCNDDDEEE